ncbi:MAG: threonylcarbamoyl-AMP synthase [Holosporaceae bacterium]|jgi:L-threonylcarbamoyladenylate synthase|nr:threonylcarbamoyl-AMP synthase [Holosporaceae bacterium]
MPQILAPDDENIERAAEVLRRGGIVAFPTETVYGLGGNAFDNASILKIYACKGRWESKPLSVCYPNFESACEDVEIDDRALLLAEKFLPGPLTIVLKRRLSSKISQLCSAGLDTLGVRVPNNAIALKLLEKLSFPLALPSANKSGERSPISAEDVFENFQENDDLVILDGGRCSVGIASTIVDLASDKIIRVGAISANQIRDVLHENS